MAYSKLGAEIWRDYVTDGVSASGAQPPIKSDIRAWMLATEQRTKDVLTADRTYYVRKDGSDLNTGLVDSAGGAFLTFQHAINVAKTLDFNQKQCTIQFGSGPAGVQTFTENLIIPSLMGAGQLRFAGNGTPANCVISGVGADAFLLNRTFSNVLVEGFKVTTTGQSCFDIANSSVLTVGNGMIFGDANFAHVYTHDNQAIAYMLGASYTIAGNASSHMAAVNGSTIYNESSIGTLVGTRTFDAFVAAATGARIQATFSTFPGTAIGSRYQASLNGTIFTDSGNANYFPGNSAGSTASGGQYSGVVNTMLTNTRKIQGVLANNAATSIDVPVGLLGFGVVSFLSTGYSCFFEFNAGAYTLTSLLEGSNGAVIDQTTGALTGTTGTNGHATISIHSDNKVYIENRLGGTVGYTLILFV